MRNCAHLIYCSQLAHCAHSNKLTLRYLLSTFSVRGLLKLRLFGLLRTFDLRKLFKLCLFGLLRTFSLRKLLKLRLFGLLRTPIQLRTFSSGCMSKLLHTSDPGMLLKLRSLDLLRTISQLRTFNSHALLRLRSLGLLHTSSNFAYSPRQAFLNFFQTARTLKLRSLVLLRSIDLRTRSLGICANCEQTFNYLLSWDKTSTEHFKTFQSERHFNRAKSTIGPPK